MGKPFVVTIANRKGGTGKSTSIVNLAAGFAAAGKKTLVIDFDTQGHAGIGFGWKPEASQPSAHDIFTKGGKALSAAIRPKIRPLIDLAPANPRLMHPGSNTPPGLLDDAIQALHPRFDYDVVLIDTPPSLDALLVCALSASNAVMIPFLAHPLALEGVKQFANVMFTVRMARQGKPKHVWLVPIQFNPKILIQKSIVNQISQIFGQNRMLQAIRTDSKLAEAFAHQQPICEFAPTSRGAMDYQLLTHQCLSLMAATDLF